MKKLMYVFTFLSLMILIGAAPKVDSSYILNSGQVIGIVLKSDGGADCPITTLPASSISVIVNNVTIAIPPSGIIWDSSLSYIALPLSSPISQTDQVAVTIPDNCLKTSIGILPGITLTPLNCVSKDISPTDFSKATMQVGWNASNVSYYNVVPVYANLGKHMSGWAPDAGITQVTDYNGNLISTTGRTVSIYRSDSGNGISGTKGGYPSLPGGIFTVVTDDPNSNFSLGGTLGIVSQTPPIFPATASYFVALQINSTKPVKNLRIYPPGQDMTQKFNSYYLDKIKDAKALRFMDAWGTNTPGLISMGNVHTTADVSYQFPKANPLTANFIRVENWSNDQSYFWKNPGWNTILVSTGAHGLTTGQRVTLSGAPTTVPLSDGSPATINGYSGGIYVVSPTTFAMPVWTGKPGTTFVATNISGKWTCNYNSVPPLDDIVELCNTTMSDMWFNVPMLFTDDACKQAFTYIAANLNPSLKCRVEFGNEHWNYAGGFDTFWYCRGQGAIDTPVINQTQWYTKRSGQIHTIAASLLGTRLVRNFGSFYGDINTTKTILTYAQANNIQVDDIGIATYLHNKPESTAMAPICDTLNVAQQMDLSELDVFSGDQTNSCITHFNLIKSIFPNATLSCYEGGPEYGGLATANGADLNRRSQTWARHPRMGQAIYPLFLRKLQEGGVSLFVDYQCVYPQSNYVWGKYIGYNQKRGKGDGSDGLFDNRTDYFALDKIVSVCGWAHEKWYAAATKNAAK